MPVPRPRGAGWPREGCEPSSPRPSAERCYTDHDLTGALAVVLGNEQFGLDDAWLTGADAAVSIPMLGHADSVNVAMAGAALLFEALRQRREAAADR